MSYILFDDFTGTTIDTTTKWTLTNPNPTYVTYAQNGTLTITFDHNNSTGAESNILKSRASISSGVAVAQSNYTWTGGGGQPISGVVLWKDSSNYAIIQTRDNVAGNTYRLRIKSGGSFVYNLDDGSTTTPPRDVKIWTDGTSIKFFYWSGSAWTQMGTTQTYSLGYNLSLVILGEDLESSTGASPSTFDNAYLSNADYSTQYPSAAVSTNSNFFLLF